MANTDNTTANTFKEPTISDLFTLMQATKNDIETMKNDVFTFVATTNSNLKKCTNELTMLKTILEKIGNESKN